MELSSNSVRDELLLHAAEDVRNGITNRLHQSFSEVHQSHSPTRLDSLFGQFQDANKPLLEALNMFTYVFLGICGLIWDPRPTWFAIFWKAWGVLVTILFLEFFVDFGIVELSFFFTQGKALGILTFLTIVTQGAGTAVAQYSNARKLRSVYRLYRPQIMSTASPPAVVMGAVTGLMCFSIVSISHQHGIMNFKYVTGISTFLLSLIVGANAFFVIGDAFTVRYIFTEVVGAFDSGLVNVSSVDKARKEILLVINGSVVASSALIGSAIANILLAFAYSVLWSADISISINFLIAILGKEFVAAAVCLYVVAEVNEMYDTLVARVGEALADECSKHDGTSTEKATQLVYLLNSLQANPIIFPLVGMTLRRKDVLLRFSIWGFGVLLSLATKRLN
jgi:hypothetical protein